MIIDHVGLFLFNNNMIFRTVGRLAFPMFVYLLADGYRRTKDVKRYLLRLAILYAVSYIPYSLAMSGGLFFATQNIYASLLLYLVLFYFLDKLSGPPWRKILAGGAACALSIVLHLQYSWYGVAAAIIMFYLHNFGVQDSCAILLFLGCLYGHALWFPLQTVGAFSLMLIPYCGEFIESPKPGKGLQWMSYFFYPVHLLFFAVLRI